MTFNERFSTIDNNNLIEIRAQMFELAKSRDYETLNYVKGAIFAFEFSKGVLTSKRFERKFLEELLDELNVVFVWR